VDISEQRLQQLAVNKLRALPAQVYLADGVVLGRLSIDPTRFRLFEGLELERYQPFVVQGCERIQFVPPSPLTHLGEITYFDVPNARTLSMKIEHRWRIAVERAHKVLVNLRQVDPYMRFCPSSWTIETDVADGDTPVHLSFHADGGYFRVVNIGGVRVADARAWSRGIIRIDHRSPPEDLWKLIRAAVDAARQRLAETAAVDTERAHFVPVEDLRQLEGLDLEVEEVEPPRQSIRVWYDSTPVTDAGTSEAVAYDDPFRDPSLVEPVSQLDDGYVGLAVVDADDDMIEDFDLWDEEPSNEVPITFSSSVSEVSSEEIMFEDAVELDFTVAQRHPIKPRPRRLDIDVAARLETPRGPATVRVMQVNASGVFVAMPYATSPQPTSEVLLRGFGQRAVRARVVHVRALDEARVLGTPEGVGLAFCSEVDQADDLGFFQESPYALVIMRDGAARERAVASLIRDGYQIIVAENLVAASAAFFQQDIAVVLMDESVHGGMWLEIGEALSFDSNRVPVVLVASRVPRVDPRLSWGHIVNLAELDGRLITEVVSRFVDRRLATGS